MAAYFIKITTTIFAAIISYLYFSQDKNISFIINKKIIKLLSVMLIIFTISALFSNNTKFGIEKTLNFFLFQVPPILLITFVLINKIILDNEKVYRILITAAIVIALFVILFVPFDQDSGIPYAPSLKRWSHVFTGRLLSTLILVVVLIAYRVKLKQNIYHFAAYGLILSAILLTELRAAALGLVITSLLFVLFEYLPSKSRNVKIYTVLTTILLLTATIFLLSSFGRFVELKNLLGGNNITDGSIISRIEAAKIVWEGFKDAPIFGHGFGSFYSDNYSSLGLMMKYPHNIFLEAIFEFGILGLIALVVLLYVIFSSAAKHERLLIYFFVFSLWMSMFSKDFATQSFLWIGIGFIRIKG